MWSQIHFSIALQLPHWSKEGVWMCGLLASCTVARTYTLMFIKHPKACLQIALGFSKGWLALQHIAFGFREWGTWIALGPTSSSSNLVNSARLHSCADLAWAKYCTEATTAWAAFAGGTFWREWKNTKLDKQGKKGGEIEDYSVKNPTMAKCLGTSFLRANCCTWNAVLW